MLDHVEPISMSEDTLSCPGCGTDFAPRRKNQQFCGRPCQQKASRNTNRGNRDVEQKARSWMHYERASRLNEMLYAAPPQERLGVMRDILAFVPTDAGLRNILTDPELHMERPRADGRLNIAKAANGYVQKFFGMSIRRYVAAIRAGETPTGILLR